MDCQIIRQFSFFAVMIGTVRVNLRHQLVGILNAMSRDQASTDIEYTLPLSFTNRLPPSKKLVFLITIIAVKTLSSWNYYSTLGTKITFVLFQVIIIIERVSSDIKPSGNDITWIVVSMWSYRLQRNYDYCSCMVIFSIFDLQWLIIFLPFTLLADSLIFAFEV